MFFQKRGKVLEANLTHSYWTTKTVYTNSVTILASTEYPAVVLLICSREHRF